MLLSEFTVYVRKIRNAPDMLYIQSGTLTRSWQVCCCSQFRQWWACCPCSRLTSGGRCSCTSPGRCEPSGRWPHYPASPGSGCCSRAGSDACSLPRAAAGSSPQWSVIGRGGRKMWFISNIFQRLDFLSRESVKTPLSRLKNIETHVVIWLLVPAQWSVWSWHCWDHGAPLQNTESQLDPEQKTGPPGTDVELKHTKWTEVIIPPLCCCLL